MQRLNSTEQAWCQIDGTLIFLDIARDRYFQLTDRENHDMLGQIQLAGLPTSHQPASLPPPSALMWAKRTSDAIGKGDFNLGEVARALWVQRRVERRLKAQGFGPTLCHLCQLLNSRHSDMPVSADAARRVISAFDHVGLIRTAADRCLPRSIALAICLASRGVSVQLVIGVKIAPFGAHCWVQAGDEVLNETVEEALRYQPILAI